MLDVPGKDANAENLVKINPYLNGIYTPTDKEMTVVDCKVEGEIWLTSGLRKRGQTGLNRW